MRQGTKIGAIHQIALVMISANVLKSVVLMCFNGVAYVR